MRPDGAVGSRDDVSSRDMHGMILDDAAGGLIRAQARTVADSESRTLLKPFRDGAAPVSVLVTFAEVRERTRRIGPGRSSPPPTPPPPPPRPPPPPPTPP